MPGGVFTDAPGKSNILKLSRSLYGLKVAARTWNKLLFKSIEEPDPEEKETAGACLGRTTR